MTQLQVDLHGERLGHLVGDNRSFDFEFASDSLARLGAGSPALSVSTLLKSPLPRAGRERRQNFFTELLPEGRNREWICSQAGLAYGDALGILRTYGRDIAGALEVWDPNVPGEPRNPELIPVTTDEVAATLSNMAAMPLGNVRGRGASSVAGVQAKLLLAWSDDGWNRAVNGYPSTHIIKPADPAAPPTTIWDEEYGARIARKLGLSAHLTELRVFGEHSALVVERYDRTPHAPSGRVHQEDFNQALGASGDQKYQRPGGKVSLARIAQIVRTHCSPDDMLALARRVVMTVAIGDLDMHAKNLSLLHPTYNDVVLAPAYDVVPHAHLGPTGEMALAIDGEYRHGALTVSHLVNELQSWPMKQGHEVVTKTLDELSSILDSEQPTEGAGPRLHEHVSHTVRALLDGRTPVAASP